MGSYFIKNAGLQQHTKQNTHGKRITKLLGTIDLPSYAWMLMALIGAILGILIRQVYSKRS
jgi:hypothetical protein